MKKTIFAFGSLAVMFLFPLSARDNFSYAQVSVSIGVFHDALSPYGDWFDYGDYGYCWRPTHVQFGWRPYVDGHWALTDYGWTWVSDYDWGWAPFHYGRWIYDDYYGWIWVPDNVWGPAWVQWRNSDDYMGWAPLPPRARWGFSLGSSSDDYGVPGFGWCFVHSWGFMSPRLAVLPYYYNTTFIGRTVNITNINIVNNRIYNHGPRVDYVERKTGRRVDRTPIYDERSAPQGGRSADRVENGRLHVYKPEVVRDRDLRDFGSARPVGASRVDERTDKTGTRVDRVERQSGASGQRSISTDRSKDVGVSRDKEKPSINQRENADRAQRRETPSWLVPDNQSKEQLKSNRKEKVNTQRNVESQPKEQPKREVQQPRDGRRNSDPQERRTISPAPEKRVSPEPRIPSERNRTGDVRSTERSRPR
jgi:hypothetical protein